MEKQLLLSLNSLSLVQMLENLTKVQVYREQLELLLNMQASGQDNAACPLKFKESNEIELKQESLVGTISLQVDLKEKQEKSRRKSFAVEQLLALEYQYAHCKYLRGQRRLIFARQLNLTDAQVKIWFQNRRAKDNRHSTVSQKSRVKNVTREVAEKHNRVGV